jgi:hypothetical protein
LLQIHIWARNFSKSLSAQENTTQKRGGRTSVCPVGFESTVPLSDLISLTPYTELSMWSVKAFNF